MNPNVIIKMIHDKNSDIILNLFICLLFIGFSASSVFLLYKLAHNGFQLQEVGDFEALNYLPPLNLIRSTKLYLTTEPQISCRCC